METFAQVAVELPITGTFTYGIPEKFKDDAVFGKRVLVPFGSRKVTGYIIAIHKETDVTGLKPIEDVLDEEPIFDCKRLEFLKWLSSYYFAPLGHALSLVHPAKTNMQSFRNLTATQKGKEAGEKGLAKDILNAAENGICLSALVKRFKGKPICSAINNLKKKGLLAEEVSIKGGGRKKTGVFLALAKRLSEDELLKLSKKSPVQAKIIKYLSAHPDCPMGLLRKSLGEISAPVKKLLEKGFINAEEKEVLRDPLSDIAPKEAPKTPNEEQAKAIDEILSGVRSGGYSPYLLYGVTGSGKTLVYLKVLEEVIKSGKKALFLAPEISLTPWPAAYLKEKFTGRVALSHSGLSDGERFDEWRRILNGEADIVVGARSALFAPMKDLGIIIVDEEHETSYKQEDNIRYNGRDASLMLAKTLGITVVLGSATPSIETFYNANTGKLKLLKLKKRVLGKDLPSAEALDMRGQKGVSISDKLKGLIENSFDKNEQALLFLNRRGFSSTLICKDCGKTFNCTNCSVSLTMHKRAGVLKCHYCDLSVPIPDACPDCKGFDLNALGAGTEKIEEEIRALFPKARVGRMDRDTTRKKGSVKKIIDAVEDRSIDLLIGTQMVSKGHHFPGISLVGVISADTSLNMPDFRSAERTFQLITQAAGRAGRGDAAGKVLVQTHNPGHYCIKNALRHDYDGFYNEEITLRQEVFYPPFVKLCCLRIESVKEAKAAGAASELRLLSERLLKKGAYKGVIVLGPSPALLSMLKGKHRWQLLVKAPDAKTLHSFVSMLNNAFSGKKRPGVSLIIDMDPLSIA